MPGLELPSQYQAIHHAGREGGRRERRKIMYNTNKVSPPFHSQPIFSRGAQSRGVVSRGWEGRYALGRNLVTRCTSVNRDKSHHLHTSPSAKPTLPTSAVGSCTGASLHPAGPVYLSFWSWAGHWKGQECWGNGRNQESFDSLLWVERPSLCCKQHYFCCSRCSLDYFEGGP